MRERASVPPLHSYFNRLGGPAACPCSVELAPRHEGGLLLSTLEVHDADQSEVRVPLRLLHRDEDSLGLPATDYRRLGSAADTEAPRSLVLLLVSLRV